MTTNNYEIITKAGYISPERALRYHQQLSVNFTWARLMMWRETKWVSNILKQFIQVPGEIILDVPCGTGILGPILRNFAVKVFCADVSLEMMKIARNQYDKKQVSNFFQADITSLPFHNGAFQFVIVLGLIHRLPPMVRKKALKEIFRVSNRHIIISFSVDNCFQRVKRRIIRTIDKGHQFAPNPIPIDEIKEELKEIGLKIRKTLTVCPLISAEKVFLLEKDKI